MINERTAKSFCNNYTEIENYNEAVNDLNQTWDCHHKKEITENKTRLQLINEDIYYNRPPEELVFLTHADHTKVHKTGKFNPMFGKHHSEEIRQIISKSMRGRSFTVEHRQKISEAKKLYWLKRNQKFNK